MKVLVTGGAGLVATHLVQTAPSEIDLAVTRRTSPVSGVVSHRVELARPGEFADLLEVVRPDVVVHTAYSMERRADVVDATEQVALGCAALGCELVHLSSDAVFSGDDPPYAETDPLDPVNDYGRWKVEAEQLVTDAAPDACVVRLSLVVSREPRDRVTGWLLEAVRAGERPVLFDDEIRTPIRAEDLAHTLWALVGLGRDERAGIWHLPGPEPLSRAELGARVLLAEGLDPGSVGRGSVVDHPAPRARDATLVSTRALPGPAPSPVR